MKKVCGLFLCLLFVINSIGSPLIYKVKKEVLTEDMEIANFDASKFKQIRIALLYENKEQTKKTTPTYSLKFNIFAIEDEERIYFDGLIRINELYETPKAVYFQKVYDSPPPQLKFLAGSKGIYWLYIWGQ